MLEESGSAPVAGRSPAHPASSPTLTLLSISARSLSRSFCQSCSCPLILATSSCIMWLSCSVVASNWMRLTLDARALLSAFCVREQHGVGTFLQQSSLRLASHPLPSPPQLLHPHPPPPALTGEEAKAHHVDLHLQVLSVGLFFLQPFYPLIQHLEAHGTEIVKGRQGRVAGVGGAEEPPLHPRCLRLLTSMSFCFCRWSSMRLLVVMLSFSQSPWTCRMALCTWPSSSSSYSRDRGAFGGCWGNPESSPTVGCLWNLECNPSQVWSARL